MAESSAILVNVKYWTAKQGKGFLFDGNFVYSDLGGICSLLLIAVPYPPFVLY